MVDIIKNKNDSEKEPMEFTKQTPIAGWFEKTDSKDGKILYIAGFSSTDGEDREGDIITEAALRFSKNHLIKQGSRTVFFNHERKLLPVGKVIKSQYKETVGDGGELVKGIWIVVQLSKAKKWEDLRLQVKEGILTSFSIGGRYIEKEERKNEEDKLVGWTVLKMELFEVSIVGVPAQTRAAIYDVALKSFEDETKGLENSQSFDMCTNSEDDSKEKEENPHSSKTQDDSEQSNYESVWEKQEEIPMSEKVKESEKKKDEDTSSEDAENTPNYISEERLGKILNEKLGPIVDNLGKLADGAKELKEKMTHKEEEKKEESEEAGESKKNSNNDSSAIKILTKKIDALAEKFSEQKNKEEEEDMAQGEIANEENENLSEQEKMLKEKGLDKSKDFDAPEVATYYMEHTDEFDELKNSQKARVEAMWLKIIVAKNHIYVSN